MIELSNELEQKIENLEKEKKELEQKIVIVESEKNSINNELRHLINYYKKSKKLEKKFEKHKESEFEECEEELDEKTKKYMEQLMKKYNVDDNTRKKDDIENNVKDFNFDNKRKKEKSDFNEHDININGLDGFNRSNIKGTRKKYLNRKVNWIYNDGIYYDQYGFDEKGLNKDGYDIYLFEEKGLNKDGLNKYGYKQSSGRGLNISSLSILFSKIYTNNSSRELINDIN